MLEKNGVVPVQGNILPTRYHEESELTTVVKTGQKNLLCFELTADCSGTVMNPWRETGRDWVTCPHVRYQCLS